MRKNARGVDSRAAKRDRIQAMGHRRSLARCALAATALLVSFAPTTPSGAVASVTLTGPTEIALGGTVQLVIDASPPGGSLSVTLEPLRLGATGAQRTKLAAPPVTFRVDGERITLTALETSAGVGDVVLRADYRQGGMLARARVALTVVEGNATAYRPQFGAGYAPLPRLAVPDHLETHATRGPGIRVHGAGETDPSSEDDLIEVELSVSHASFEYALRRSSAALAVWTTRNKVPGTQLAFTGNVTQGFALPGGTRTAWVEWTGAHGTAELSLEPAGSATPVDRVRFHTFHSIVMALGGESQVPSDPVDPNHGTFVVGLALYANGYDVFLYDEDNVSPTGAGSIYDEIVNAIQHRGVEQVVSFGYSHGGGSTYDLADRLDANRGSIGTFSIPFTSYVDSVENDSDTDTAMELRYPPSSLYHANHYQHGSFFEDLGLDGGPVPGSDPPPTGLDVETTPWGASATHFLVDDYQQVTDFIAANLDVRVTR